MDGALIERARKGDADAFDELVRARIDAMYRTALGILGNSADARDATQDALVAAWRSIGSLRDAASIDGWFYRVTLNAARMTARKRRSIRELRLESEPEPIAAGEVSTTDFDRAFERLTVEQRALLMAHHLDGLSVAEVASRLGIPEGTVKSRLFAARQALDRALRGAD